MDIYESGEHRFIVEVCLEETAEEAGQATWHGRITHVPSGNQRYMRDLDDVTEFILPYLLSMGAKPGRRWHARRRPIRLWAPWKG
jgi:hypothetical protein